MKRTLLISDFSITGQSLMFPEYLNPAFVIETLVTKKKQKDKQKKQGLTDPAWYYLSI
jgi:hypothetical protein